eukprot:Gb_32646 [translate_table: standard]
MGRYRSRSRSYSPRRSRSPAPRRKRYDDYRDRDRDRYRERDRDRFRDRRSAAPTGLLVRNISLDARPEDLRVPFERFGPVKDVYLPRNYYTGEPRGFGFVKYRNPDDAAEAKYHMNHQVIGGREITIVFAEENRKNPQEMRASARSGGRSGNRFGGGGFRRRTPPRSPRRRHHSYSRSPSPPRRGSRGHATREDDYSEARSVSPLPRSDVESRSPQGFQSAVRSPPLSPKENGRSPTRRQMPVQDCSP